MDDILTGTVSLDATHRLLDQVISLCMADGFPLRKWTANDDYLLERIPLEHCLGATTGARLPSQDHSVLGLRWHPGEDAFSLSVRLIPTASTDEETHPFPDGTPLRSTGLTGADPRARQAVGPIRLVAAAGLTVDQGGYRRVDQS